MDLASKTELIDKGALIGRLLDKHFYPAIVRAEIEKAPVVDAEPVRHGHWLLLDECANAGVYCTRCGKKVYKEQYANQKIKSKYCPNCGAKMDEEADDDQIQ